MVEVGFENEDLGSVASAAAMTCKHEGCCLGRNELMPLLPELLWLAAVVINKNISEANMSDIFTVISVSCFSVL